MEALLLIILFIGVLWASAIPAYIASAKGRSFFLWWVYGGFLFPFAMIHSIVIKPNENAPEMMKCQKCASIISRSASICPFCQSILNVKRTESPVALVKENEFYIYKDERNIESPAYQLFLVKNFNIEKNNTLEKYVIKDEIFENLHAALTDADKRYSIIISKFAQEKAKKIADERASELVRQSLEKARETKRINAQVEEEKRQELLRVKEIEKAENNRVAIRKAKPYIIFGFLLLLISVFTYINIQLSVHEELKLTWKNNGKIFKDCDECPELVKIPSGSFEMMGPTKEMKGFLLGRTEVTQRQWYVVMGVAPSEFSSCGDNCPVENVSWEDAKEFAKRLSEKTGKLYRLPSESEWEYAARAGSTTIYNFNDDGLPFGDTRNYSQINLDEYAWYDSNSALITHQVAQKRPNMAGLFDMYGNVWEWVEDSWHKDSSNGPKTGAPWIDQADNLMRVARGGSWLVGVDRSTSVSRINFYTNKRDYFTGFRIAREI
jgi:formylglycine-generating enzyme required for sulfatase activity